MIRTVNGLLGAAATILFGIHGISMGLFLAGYLPYSYTRKYWGYALLVCVVLHAVISIALVIFEKGKNKGDKYAKANKESHIQRVLGIITIVFIALHMNAYGYFTEDWVYIVKEATMAGFAAQVGLALLAGLHLMIGFPKSMISLGYIREPKDLKSQKNFAYMLVFATWFVAIYGACNYFGVI